MLLYNYYDGFFTNNSCNDYAEPVGLILGTEISS